MTASHCRSWFAVSFLDWLNVFNQINQTNSAMKLIRQWAENWLDSFRIHSTKLKLSWFIGNQLNWSLIESGNELIQPILITLILLIHSRMEFTSCIDGWIESNKQIELNSTKLHSAFSLLNEIQVWFKPSIRYYI